LYRSKRSWRPAIQGKGNNVPGPKQKQDKLAEPKSKGTDSLVQTISMTSLLNIKAKGTDSLYQSKGTRSRDQASKPYGKPN
jgi:hypothetical protein